MKISNVEKNLKDSSNTKTKDKKLIIYKISK